MNSRASEEGDGEAREALNSISFDASLFVTFACQMKGETWFFLGFHVKEVSEIAFICFNRLTPDRKSVV